MMESLTWLGKLFTSPSDDETLLEAAFETDIDMIIRIYIYIYIYIYICIYLKLLYIDIKSSSYVHEFYTSKYIPILLTTMFFKPPMHIMHVCSAQFDFTWTLYTTEFTWTLYTKDNTVYIHLRMYTCFMLFLIVCSIVFINMSVFVSNYAIKIFNKKYIHNELGCWQCKCEHT